MTSAHAGGCGAEQQAVGLAAGGTLALEAPHRARRLRLNAAGSRLVGRATLTSSLCGWPQAPAATVPWPPAPPTSPHCHRQGRAAHVAHMRCRIGPCSAPTAQPRLQCDGHQALAAPLPAPALTGPSCDAMTRAMLQKADGPWEARQMIAGRGPAGPADPSASLWRSMRISTADCRSIPICMSHTLAGLHSACSDITNPAAALLGTHPAHQAPGRGTSLQ